MVRVGGVLVLVLAAAVAASAQDRIDIAVADGLVSVEADRVGLGALLDELDRAAGTTSTVPGELEGHVVSIRFAQLPLDLAIEKVFAGLAIDYAVLGGDRIVVLAASRSVTPTAVAWPGAPVGNSLAPPAGRGAFALPGVDIGETEAVDPRARDRGGRGFEQLLQVAPDGRLATPSLPGLGTVLPFGVIPHPPGGPGAGGQPAPAFIGNTAPAILDLNQSPTAPAGPGTSPQPVPSGPQSSP